MTIIQAERPITIQSPVARDVAQRRAYAAALRHLVDRTYRQALADEAHFNPHFGGRVLASAMWLLHPLGIRPPRAVAFLLWLAVSTVGAAWVAMAYVLLHR